jgi:hypothetical protein
VLASKEKWEKLEGSFSLTNMPKCVVFYLEGPPGGVDLIIDSVTITRSEHKQSKVNALCVHFLNLFLSNILYDSV